MAADDDEEERLRAVALQNAQSILVARRRAEEALRKQSEWLRITLASIGDAVISTDAEGRVTFMNAVAEALTGWPQAEALGQPAAGRLPHRQRRHPPAGREPRPACAAGGDDRRAGEPHGPHRPDGRRAADRRQRRADAGRVRGHGRGGPGVPRRHRAASGPRSRARSWRPSSNRPTTRSSARRSRASSCRGTPGPSGCSATRAEEAVGQPITLIIPPERLDEEQHDPRANRSRGAGRAFRDGARVQGRPPDRHLADHFADSRRRRGRSSAPRKSPATSLTARVSKPQSRTCVKGATGPARSGSRQSRQRRVLGDARATSCGIRCRRF